MKKTLLIFIIALISSCSSTKEKQDDIFIIPLSHDYTGVLPFEESDLQVSYEFIPIMTDTSILEAFVNGSASLKTYKDYYYFFSNMGISGANFKIFDKNGKFIKSSVTGKGPGELGTFVSDLYFDKENDFIQIVNYNKIMSYDLEGKYVGDSDIDISYSNFYKFGDYRLTCSSAETDSGYIKIVNNYTGRLVDVVIEKEPGNQTTEDISSDGKNISILRRIFTSNFTEYDSNLYFNLRCDNFIYKINKGDSIPYKFARIENVPNIEDIKSFNHEEMQNYLIDNKLFSSIYDLAFFSDNLLAFTPLEGKIGGTTRVIYDKTSNKTFKHPTPTAILMYFDGEYEYFHVNSFLLEMFKKANVATEKAIVDEIEKINGDMETCIVRVKITKK